MLYLIYSIVTWSISSFPRVKSSFETYFAFGQPTLTVIGGMALVLMILACTNFSSKSFVGFFWILLSLTLFIINLYRLSDLVNDTTYERTLQSHKEILAVDITASFVTICRQIFEGVVVIAYLCDQADLESREAVGEESSTVRVMNGSPVMMAGQPMFLKQQYRVVTGYTPAYPYPLYRSPYYGPGDALMLGLVAGSAMHGFYDPCYDGFCMF
jgi:hypothetical protein